MARYMVEAARVGINEDEYLADDLLVAEVMVRDEDGKIFYLCNADVVALPHIIKADRSVFERELNLLFEEEGEERDAYLEWRKDRIVGEDSYSDLFEHVDPEMLDVYRYLAYITRCDGNEAADFINDTKGKYMDEISIPLTDVEKEWLTNKNEKWYEESSHLRIVNARVDVTAGGMACGPVPGAVVSEASMLNDDGKVYFLSMTEFMGCPMFYVTDKSTYEEQMNLDDMNDEYIEWLESQQVSLGDSECTEYDEILEAIQNDPKREVYRYMIYLVRASWEDAEAFIKNTIGKYVDEIVVPECDIEVEMREEV